MDLPLNENIFKAYDIRGEYGKDFDADFAMRLGMAFVEYAKPTRVIVAIDDRQSSKVLVDSLIQGIVSAGSDVVNIGNTSTPLFYFAVSHVDNGGGIMVTASHLGPNFNGFKLIGKDGASIYTGHGLENIKKIMQADSANQWIKSSKKYGAVTCEDLMDDYVSFLVKLSGFGGKRSNRKIKIEAPPVVQKEINLLTQLVSLELVSRDEDIAFHFDPDGDRLAISVGGVQIKSDYLLGILLMDFHKGLFCRRPKVVYDLRFSHKLVDYLAKQGVKMIRSRVGRVFFQDMMVKHKADIGSEISGHVYFKETGGFESTILAMLKVLKIIEKSGQSIKALLKPFEVEFLSGEINLPLDPGFSHKDELIKKISENYNDGKSDFLDGVSIKYEKWWCNVRFSNTEDLARLVAGANSQQLLDEKIAELSEFIKSVL